MPLVIEAMRGTKGWVRFMAVLGFIASAFMLIGVFGIFVGGSVGRAPAMGAGIFALIYLILVGVYFVLALKLNQYASRIGAFLLNPNGALLASALDAQRSFWKYLGIMTIVILCFYFFAIVLVVGTASRFM